MGILPKKIDVKDSYCCDSCNVCSDEIKNDIIDQCQFEVDKAVEMASNVEALYSIISVTHLKLYTHTQISLAISQHIKKCFEEEK